MSVTNMTDTKRSHGFKGRVKGAATTVSDSPLIKKFADHTINKAGV